jgi:hypothetical protein
MPDEVKVEMETPSHKLETLLLLRYARTRELRQRIL